MHAQLGHGNHPDKSTLKTTYKAFLVMVKNVHGGSVGHIKVKLTTSSCRGNPLQGLRKTWKDTSSTDP